ncbi:MAG TPA: AAA family ATPase [Kofleriaceae bacterium]
MSATRLSAPPPPAVFVGRDAELARLAVGMQRVSVALIYGVAGVGKSSLASAFASTWTGPIIYCRLGSQSTIAIVCEDLLRQLDATGSTLSDAAAKLDERTALWVLDDLHRLPIEEQSRFVRELGHLLRTGRVIATSRQLLPFETDGPDRLEVRLGGLDATSAQTLWTSLDELHGATPGFDAMWSKARGNPLRLRQAHACRPLAEDHIETAVRALGDGERRVATALALCELPLPTHVAHALAPDGNAQLATLVSRMIVDPAGPGLWQLHDLFREALVAGLDDSLARELHGELARLLADADVDPVLRAREVTRHLRAIGDNEGCARYLLAQEPTLLKEGATAELLRGLEAIPAERRAPIVTVTIARTRARMLELERSYRELERLVARPEHAIPEAWLVLGQVALLRGEMQAAATALHEAEQQASVPSFLRQLIQISAAIVDTHRGASDVGHRRLLEAERVAADSDEAGVLVLMRCFLAWLEERDDQLEAMLRPNEWFTGCVAALRANVVAPGLAAVLCARLGRFDEAEAHFAQASAALRRDEDLLSRVTLAFTRASIDFERGERVVAATQLEELARVHEARGHVIGTLVCNSLLARALLVMGRRAAAHRLLEATAARTSQLGIVSIDRQLTRTRDEDVVRQLVAGIKRQVPGARGSVARAQALEAMRIAATGDEAAARRLVEQNAALVTGPGYGIERALAQLATAIGARLDGREREAMQAIDRATAALVEDGADPALVADLLDAVGRVRAIQPHSRQLLPAARATELVASVIVDARSAEIRSRDGVISLRKRPLIGKLFFGLASKPGTVWSKDALVELVWGTSYSPQIHDNPLKVSITRLRSLIGDQMSVEFDGDGYRLAVPDQFLYLDVPTSNPE